MQRFFIQEKFNILQKGQNLKLPFEIFHHAVDVLRMKKGTRFELVDATEKVFCCELTNIQKKDAMFKILNMIDHSVEMPVKVTIACGIPKGTKAEEIVKKGTQLGSDNFIFLNTEYAVASWKKQKQLKKIQRLQTIALNAAEQSHRTHIPHVSFVNSITELIKVTKNDKYKVVAYEESAKKGEKSALRNTLSELKQDLPSSIVAFFGPEGGVASTEVIDLVAAGFIKVALGPRILRAETAPLYFLSALSFVTELN